MYFSIGGKKSISRSESNVNCYSIETDSAYACDTCNISAKSITYLLKQLK